MTMIVALHLKAYVLIAADNREVFMSDGEVMFVNNDNVNKLIEWSGGVATGSGYAPLLNEFKNQLHSATIETTDKIVEIAKACVKNLPEEQSGWKESTNWLFTYDTDLASRRTTRVAFIESNAPEGAKVLNEGESLIWAKIPNYNEVLADINRQLTPCDDFLNLEESIERHIAILRSLFTYVSSVNETVSSSFNCFFQAPEGRKMVQGA